MAPNNPPRRFTGLPLYLRIWLAVVGAVLVITLAFAWLWRANADEAPSGLRGREREIILRDANGEVLGRTRSRPVFVPGHGVEFAVPMEDGRTVIVHIPPRERPDEERGPESRGASAGDDRPVPGSLSGMHRGGPPMLGPAPPSRPWLRGTNGLLIMLAVAPEARTRVMGLLTLGIGMAPFGFLNLGWMADHLGAGPALIIMAFEGLALWAWVAWKWPER